MELNIKKFIFFTREENGFRNLKFEENLNLWAAISGQCFYMVLKAGT